MVKLILNIVFLILVFSINAQHYFYGDNQRVFQLESSIYQSDSNKHSVIKPYNFKAARSESFKDSSFHKGVWLYGSDLNNKKAIFLPVIGANYIISPQESNANLSTSIGAQCELNFNSKISFFSRYVFRRGSLSNFSLDRTHNRSTVQGFGLLSDSTNEFQIHQFDFNLSAILNKYILFSIGKGKNFFGDGYRSLLLSDFAPSYPYIKIESEFWKVKYVNLYSMHVDNYNGQENKKFSSTHTLSWNINKAINLSIFESVVWAAKDSLNQRNFDVNYLNPIIFFRPVEYSIGSADNSFLGANLKLRVFKKHIFYGQLLVDEFLLNELRSGNGWWANKYGFQFGYKVFDLFGVKGLGAQIEYNEVRPFTYSHVVSQQNYGHMNHSLAHPYEANFKEFLIRMRFQKNNFNAELNYAYQRHGANTFGNYGGDMFFSYTTRLNEYDNFTLQGDLNVANHFGALVSYQLIAKSNTALFSNVVFRTNSHPQISNDLLISFGVKSNLWNTYLDY